jgi:hypothetical protein
LFGGLIEHECPRCGRAVELPLGALCHACVQEVEGRARRLGRRVALITTALLGVYIVWRMPPDPTARMVGAAAAIAWYVLTRVIVTRTAREFFR